MLYINNVQKTQKIRYNRKPFFCDMFLEKGKRTKSQASPGSWKSMGTGFGSNLPRRYIYVARKTSQAVDCSSLAPKCGKGDCG
jgi:hypothetical protein